MNDWIDIHPKNPEPRKIQQVVSCLVKGGVIIYPTDSIYGLGCAIDQEQAILRICQLRKLDPEKAMLTVICRDLSEMASMAAQIDNSLFRVLKKNIPGPFTFILKAAHHLPRTLRNRKGSIGLRCPEHPITRAILQELGGPILSISLKAEAEDEETYPTDPEQIREKWGKLVNLIIDGGPGNDTPSTVVDCTGNEPEITRQGAGELRL